MSNPYRDRLLSVGVLTKGQSKSQTVREDTKGGIRRKHVTDAAGNVTTEWNSKDDRVDVEIHPKPVDVKLEMKG